MKKSFILALMTLLIVMGMAACGSNEVDTKEPADPVENKPDEKVETSIMPLESIDDAEEYTKELIPVTYAEGEEFQAVYYKRVSENDDTFYEVQPKGEETPLRLPLESTTLYGVETDEECCVKKLSVDLVAQGGSEAEKITVYQVFSKTGGAQ